MNDITELCNKIMNTEPPPTGFAGVAAFGYLSGFLVGYLQFNDNIPNEQKIIILNKVLDLHNRCHNI